MAFQFDCSRSSVLNYEFPLPLFPAGHTTGSTNSTWGQRWTTLHYWDPTQIATEFNHYWNSTVSTVDKNELIYSQTVIEWIIASLGNHQQVATVSTRYVNVLMQEYHGSTGLHSQVTTIGDLEVICILPYRLMGTLYSVVGELSRINQRLSTLSTLGLIFQGRLKVFVTLQYSYLKLDILFNFLC